VVAEEPSEPAEPGEISASERALETSASEGVLDTAWEKVEADWEDDDVHQKFVALCDTLGRLDEAGARYRAIAAEDESRAARAEKSIKMVIARAMIGLQAMQSEPTDRPRKIIYGVGLLVAATLLIVTLLAWTGAF